MSRGARSICVNFVIDVFRHFRKPVIMNTFSYSNLELKGNWSVNSKSF